MVIHHRIVSAELGRLDEARTDGQFGKIVVTL
jgi:hypothetical protein